MSSLGLQIERPRAQRVVVTDDSVVIDLTDGRTVSAPLSWYPRLVQGTPAERENWRLVGSGEGVHWPMLDEDLSVEGLIAGRPSGESAKSLRRWLEKRDRRANGKQQFRYASGKRARRK